VSRKQDTEAPLRAILPSVAFVLVGLAARALVDKLLVTRGGTAAVAQWAQVSNVADLVASVSLTGMGIALTALSAGSATGDRLQWIKPALLASLGVSFVVGAATLPVLLTIGSALVPAQTRTILLALAVGWSGIAPGLVIAHFLGTRQIARAITTIAIGFFPPALALVLAPAGAEVVQLLTGQLLFNAFVVAALAWALRSEPRVTGHALRTLLRFVPAGLAIGILSPVALVWARSEIAEGISWTAVGQVQAIWRTSDWVTAVMGGVLNAHFLPRLAGAGDHVRFAAVLRRAALWTIVPAGLALAVLALLFPWILPLLYRADAAVARQDALLFLLGDWMRVISWVALFGLFARRWSWAVAVGEFFSLPLFAVLVAALGPRQLSDVGLLWFLAYLVYALLNWWLLLGRRYSA